MDRAIPALVIVGIVVVWYVFINEQSKGRMWTPLWLAFSVTAMAILYVGAGATGYMLSRRDRFVAQTAWAGHVIWWEVAIGVVAGLVAILFWRKGLQALRPA